MTFPSLTFAIFFVVVLAVHRSPLGWSVRKGLLLVGSWFFYAVWNPPFVALLWLSTAVDWFLAHRIHKEENPGTRKLYVVASLCTNLGLLGFFKYGTFLTENFLAVAEAAGAHLDLSPPSVVLPVGISFYTFQTLSYTIDVYRRRLTPGSSLLDYALYVSFFPQLVAGPIVRAGHFIPQCEVERKVDAKTTSWGLTLLALGLFEKVVLADSLLAPVVDLAYAQGAQLTSADAWGGTLAFAGQIFCDFSGYSTCAIGTALTLGFHLPDNFRAPYAAVGFSDFWRRWHISLSSWLRDYLYIPLGGNRHGLARTLLALFATMLLGGLWHGASWTFVAWGGLHGLYLVGERLAKKLLGSPTWARTFVGELALGLLTFVLVCFAWVFFRAETFADAFAVLKAMLGSSPAIYAVVPTWQRNIALAVVALLLVAHQVIRHQTLEDLAGKLPTVVRAAAIALFLALLALSPGTGNDFIYFQF